MRYIVVCVLVAVLGEAAWAGSGERPNIIVLLADDMGYSDLGCFGGEVRTPNLDRLAAKGLRFTHFYNTGRCCPTRAALLTGLYSHQAGVGRMTADEKLPGYRGTLAANCVTIAEILRRFGYRTGMVGKWHLSPTRVTGKHMAWLNHQEERDRFSDPATYPTARGFEDFYGTIWGVSNFFDPFSLTRGVEPVRTVPKGYYYTDAINDHAVAFVEKYARGKEPFFLYVAHHAPHWPLHALPEDIARYRDTYKVGWDAVRRDRYRRMIEKKLLDPKTAPLSARIEPQRRWEDNPHRDWDAACMAVHAAMIDRMDQGIGRLIDRLEKLGKLDDTLILFLSDNGASAQVPTQPGFDRHAQTRDGRKVIYFGPKSAKKVLPGAETTYAAIDPMWANVSNTPLRWWKAQMNEGGTCTPLIAHWPAGLKVSAGSITEQPGHVIDILATCIDLAGAAYPAESDGRRITPLEGKSLVPILRGKQRPGHDALYFEHFGGRAVRRGNWKLVAHRGQPWELYDLSRDRTETRDLAAEHPDRVRDLSALWDAWARRAQVLPSPDSPKKKP